uniref:replication helicase subunit n=1 Tax=Nitzschia dubiiformis TaxID=515482 RepID=UPI002115223D|nr:replication helicase subunit [Nitzschia dubiiformis]UTQ75528.1 replication helicase subunit [Nitzschia dubiiformis]
MNKKQMLIEKSLPHNFLAEKLILSCLIINSETLAFVIKTLPIEAFYFKNHEQIYRAIIFMSKYELSIDIFSLTAFLQKNGLLKEIGGIGILIEFMNEIPNLVNLEEYIQLVKDKFFRRLLIKFGYKTINIGYITNIPLEKILEELDNELLNLTNKTKTNLVPNSAELLNGIFFKLKEQFLNPSFSGLPSGFSNLDVLTQGFQKSELIILAGRPSMGKTALSLNITLNSLKISKLPVLFFSLEMSQEQIMYRLLAIETGISQTRLKNGQLYKNDWIKFNKAIKVFSKLPFFIDDSPNLSINGIRSKIKQIFIKQNELGLVIIDYLQLIQNLNIKNENRVQQISTITRLLKNLAREFNIPIIALSQLNRNVENRVDSKPTLSDLRESGSIEQDSDLVLLLYDGKYALSSDSIIELIIAKQRNGPIGTVKFSFNKKYIKFIEWLET